MNPKNYDKIIEKQIKILEKCAETRKKEESRQLLGNCFRHLETIGTVIIVISMALWIGKVLFVLIVSN